MENMEYALKLFAEGFNCSQSVFAAAARNGNLDETLARKISLPFGGGISRNGEMCGAVTGALMALGLTYGSAETGPDVKNHMYSRCNAFMDEFRKRHGSVTCRDLIECDLSTEEGRKTAAERKVHTDVCPRYIRTAMEILSAG